MNFLNRSQRPRISDVFTPRNSEINTRMYIERAELERNLKRSLEGSLHIVLCGESGVAKSWLFKKVLIDLEAEFEVVNFGNVAANKRIRDEISRVLHRDTTSQQIGHQDTVQGELGVLGVSINSSRTSQYIMPEKDSLEAIFKKLRERAKEKPAVLVFDNLKMIFNDDNKMRELAGTVVLLDDKNHAAYRVKILIVGVPKEIRTYFQKVQNLPTLTTRLKEIEISRLQESQMH